MARSSYCRQRRVWLWRRWRVGCFFMKRNCIIKRAWDKSYLLTLLDQTDQFALRYAFPINVNTNITFEKMSDNGYRLNLYLWLNMASICQNEITHCGIVMPYRWTLAQVMACCTWRCGTSHYPNQWGLMAFTPGQFYRNCSRFLSVKTTQSVKNYM